jgi:hypothetical protein
MTELNSAIDLYSIPASFGVQFCWINRLCHSFYPQL